MATAPAPQLLFNRKVEVRIAAPVTSFNVTGQLVLTVTEMRVQFKVKKTSKKEPNKAEVVITNLKPDSRALVQRQGGKFILLAGYAETGVEQLFNGDIRNVSHVRENADWNTTIHSGDGERAYRWARVNASFKGGTPVQDVINKILASLGLDRGNVDQFLGDMTSQFVHGYSAQGWAQAELDHILRAEGFTWSIQDGAVQLLKNDATLAGFIPELGPDTGLVGSPEFGASEKNKGPKIKFKCLLTPKIRIGGKIKFNSERFKGEVRVVEVEHTGDTAGGDWYSECEAEPLP